ncbi:MAG: hypothetical protein AABY95_07995 [Pseudomonadota bacterium]
MRLLLFQFLTTHLSLHTQTRRPYRVVPLSTPVANTDQVLARVRFGHAVTDDDPRTIVVPLPQLSGDAGELWLSDTAVETGWSHGIGYCENAHVLFGQHRISEAEISRHGLDRAVFHAYVRIEQLLVARGYPYWLRIWNYISGILDGDNDRERYRQFNLGRHRALSIKPGFETCLPAATAIGTPGEGLLIYFLAGRAPGQPVENPRQMNAWRYPQQYGPRSPSFSRASLLDWSDGAELLVSGTASVVGHESRHAGDIVAQLAETLTNLDSLRAEAERLKGFAPNTFKPQTFKLYVVDRAQLPRLQPMLAARPEGACVSGLEGTICRNDLHVEIEGSYRVHGA